MATVIAAATAKARRDIQHYFFKEDAVRPERAVRFEAHNRIQERQFERMQASGIIREAKPGYYWIDIPVYDSELQRRLMTLRTILLIVLSAALIVTLIATYGIK